MAVVKIKKITYKKVEEDIDFNVPDVTKYFFIFGVRISVRVVPIWTTWNKEHNNKEEEIFQLAITIVNCSHTEIKYSEIGIYQIPDLLQRSAEYLKDILKVVHEPEPGEIRTKEDFQKDFDSVIAKINENV